MMEAAAATLDRRKKMETHPTNDTLCVPPWGDVEVDKIPGYWVLTLWLPDDVTLRLRVRHIWCEEPDDCIAEIRLKPDEEFHAIHEFSIAAYTPSHPDEFPEVWDDMSRLTRRQHTKALRLTRSTLSRTAVRHHGNGTVPASIDNRKSTRRWRSVALVNVSTPPVPALRWATLFKTAANESAAPL